MALNLSTLTSPATSGDVLAEALTTADFLEPVPVLRNLARGSQKGGDAKQDVALNQPKALPLIDGKGYCYLPATTGNAPAVTFPTIGANDDFVLEMDVYLVDVSSLHLVSGSTQQERIIIYNSGSSFQCNLGTERSGSISSLLTEGVSTVSVERTSGTITLKQNGVTKGTINNVTGSATFSHLSWNGQYSTGVAPLNGYIQKATLSIGGTEQLKVDFTATNVRHGDTKFKCATGQVVTINQAGNDPSTVIKKSVLRFDGANDFMDGVFNQTITDGYMFAAFSVLGDGGASSGRVFSTNETGLSDASSSGAIFSLRQGTSNDLRVYQNGYWALHSSLFSKSHGDILHESLLKNGSQISRVNDADENISTAGNVISVEEFNIVSNWLGSNNAALDLEFLALFPSSITDAQADDVRNYINNRNNVFDLKDGFGYYFYDAQKAPAVPITSGSSSWNGRIVGSDNGDTNRYATQGTSNDAPVGDGYVVTFADNTDHLEIPQVTQAGWQVVGTSLGTFAYRVNNTAVTELNLLGNLGNASHRKAGDLYGVILLPDSATGADIEEARKLLIDRGSLDGSLEASYFTSWLGRTDIVEFKFVDLSNATNVQSAWQSCTAMNAFPALNLSSSTTLSYSWYGCSGLSNFGAIQAPVCTDFSNAWLGTSALTSFPADAKLGTEVTNVNFTDAWRSSGLTSFSTPLPTATGFTRAWFASSITSFDLDILPEGIAFSATWQQTNLSSFHTKLPKAISLEYAWYNNPQLTEFTVESLPECVNNYWAWRSCNLTSFSTSLPKTRQVSEAWRNNSNLTDFSAEVFANWNPSVISNYVFHDTWKGCTSLTAQSVENILVSIDASGKYGTATGAAGGGSIDSGIDIDYDGTTLSAATNSAVDSLKAKGWSIIVNNVTL